MKRLISGLIVFFFLTTSILPNPSFAQSILNLPIPGSVVATTAGFAPAIIKGINLYPDNPLKFDFIIDKGDTTFTDQEFKKESTKLIKYFLSSLTVPENEMWVNLSPYEKNRIVPETFGQTEMGRDLLAQDYMLKQLTASLMNPDDKLGGEFWQRVYTKAQEKYGSTDIPMNTFNKIWIIPEKAVVYEHEKGAFVVKSHLKVMLEEDYLALEANKNSTKHGLGDVKTEDLKIVSGVQSTIIKDLLIPEIEKEVNEGKTFANLRQIYNAVILASWYKQALKESLLGQVYVDQKKLKGVETVDKTINQKIYDQYIKSFKKGVYNFVKEDYDPDTQEVVNRKYFSGGIRVDLASLATETSIDLTDPSLEDQNSAKVEVDLASVASEMTIEEAVKRNLTKEYSPNESLEGHPLFNAWYLPRTKEFDERQIEFSTIDPQLNSRTYLTDLDNSQAEIKKVEKFITESLSGSKPLLLEIGSGNTKVAHAIATHQNGMNIIATDQWTERSPTLDYQQYARDFMNGDLIVQTSALDNVAAVRAETDVTNYIPDGSLDYILLVNPAVEAVKDLVILIREFDLIKKLKKNGRIIIKSNPQAEEFFKLIDKEFRYTASDEYEMFGLNLHETADYNYEIFKGKLFVLEQVDTTGSKALTADKKENTSNAAMKADSPAKISGSYVVQEDGETLSQIAANYGMPEKTILQENADAEIILPNNANIELSTPLPSGTIVKVDIDKDLLESQIQSGLFVRSPYGVEQFHSRSYSKLDEAYDITLELNQMRESPKEVLLIGVGRGVAAMGMAIRYPNLSIVAVNKEDGLWNDKIVRKIMRDAGYQDDEITAARQRISVKILDIEDESQRRLELGVQTYDVVLFEREVQLYFKDRIKSIEDIFNEFVNVNGIYGFALDHRLNSIINKLRSVDKNKEEIRETVTTAFQSTASQLLLERPEIFSTNAYYKWRKETASKIHIPLISQSSTAIRDQFMRTIYKKETPASSDTDPTDTAMSVEQKHLIQKQHATFDKLIHVPGMTEKRLQMLKFVYPTVQRFLHEKDHKAARDISGLSLYEHVGLVLAARFLLRMQQQYIPPNINSIADVENIGENSLRDLQKYFRISEDKTPIEVLEIISKADVREMSKVKFITSGKAARIKAMASILVAVSKPDEAMTGDSAMPGTNTGIPEGLVPLSYVVQNDGETFREIARRYGIMTDGINYENLAAEIDKPLSRGTMISLGNRYPVEEDIEKGLVVISPYDKEDHLTRPFEKLNSMYTISSDLEQLHGSPQRMLLIGVGRGMAAIEAALKYPNLSIVAVNKEKGVWSDIIIETEIKKKGYTDEQISAARKRITLKILDIEDENQRRRVIGDEGFDVVLFESNVQLYFKNRIKSTENIFNEYVKNGGIYGFELDYLYNQLSHIPKSYDDRFESAISRIFTQAFTPVAEFKYEKKNPSFNASLKYKRTSSAKLHIPLILENPNSSSKTPSSTYKLEDTGLAEAAMVAQIPVKHMTPYNRFQNILINGFYNAIGVRTFLALKGPNYPTYGDNQQIEIALNIPEDLIGTEPFSSQKGVYMLTDKAKADDNRARRVLGDDKFNSMLRASPSKRMGHVPARNINFFETIKRNKERTLISGQGSLDVTVFNAMVKDIIQELQKQKNDLVFALRNENYAGVLAILKPHKDFLEQSLESFQGSEELLVLQKQFNEFKTKAQVGEGRRIANVLANDGFLDEALSKYLEVMGHIKNSEDLDFSEAKSVIEKAVKKIENLQQPIKDINDVNSYQAFFTQNATQQKITESVHRPDLDKDIHVFMIEETFKRLSGESYTKPIMLIVASQEDGSYRAVARASVTLENKMIREPGTVTYVKKNSYMQRAVTLLLLTETIEQWTSSMATQDSAKEMYKRMKEDARLSVEERGGQYIVTKKINTGGIDLNPTILNTEIKRNGRGVIIPTFKGPVPDLNGIEGFVPNIINVTPITNLPLLLGIAQPNEETPIDVSYNLSALPAEHRKEENVMALSSF